MKKYYFSADILRSLSAIGVVVLHSFDSIYFRPDFFGGKSWWITHIIMAFFRTAVPIFILLSGYLNLGTEKSFSQIFTKTKKRIFVPLFSFFSLYIEYDLLTQRLPWNGLQTIAEIINKFNINTQTLLYFLIVLIFLYILTPFFNVLFKESKNIQKKFIIGFLVLGAVILITRITTFRNDEYFYNSYNTWISYIGYYLLGYYIKQVKLTTKQYIMAFIIFLLSFVVTIMGTYFMFLYKTEISQYILVDNITYFANYQSINVILQSITLFILIIHSKFLLKTQKGSIFEKITQFVAQNSFGIFLIHILVLYTLNFSIDNFITSNISLFLFITFSSCFLITLLLTILLRKTPLKCILGE